MLQDNTEINDCSHIIKHLPKYIKSQSINKYNLVKWKVKLQVKGTIMVNKHN